jgi:hypothetical protein
MIRMTAPEFLTGRGGVQNDSDDSATLPSGDDGDEMPEPRAHHGQNARRRKLRQGVTGYMSDRLQGHDLYRCRFCKSHFTLEMMMAKCEYHPLMYSVERGVYTCCGRGAGNTDRIGGCRFSTHHATNDLHP